MIKNSSLFLKQLVNQASHHHYKSKNLIECCLLISSCNEYSTNVSSNSKNTRRSDLKSTPAASSQSKIRLVDYLTRKDLEASKSVQMDYVSNTELKYYDPPYLAREAPFPNYNLLNINIKGYDYSVLDPYFKYIEKLCTLMNVEVVDAYKMPSRNLKIKTYQPFSSNLDKEYALNMYHRVVRIKNLKSTLAPILFETIQLNLPQGVQLGISVPTREEDEFRYVPDIELQELRKSLEDMSKRPKNEEATATAAAASTSSTSTAGSEKK